MNCRLLVDFELFVPLIYRIWAEKKAPNDWVHNRQQGQPADVMHHDNLTKTITVHARDHKYPDDEVHVDTSATPQFRARLYAVVGKNQALRLHKKFIEKHSKNILEEVLPPTESVGE
jgi:hypothetical protein